MVSSVVTAPASTREAPPRFPLNFYDKALYDNLSRRDERVLQAVDEAELTKRGTHTKMYNNTIVSQEY